MTTRYLLATVALAFLIAALIRGRRTIQGRTWLLIAVILGIVSTWLFAKR
jgi:DMSO reductase anchor subunit